MILVSDIWGVQRLRDISATFTSFEISSNQERRKSLYMFTQVLSPYNSYRESRTSLHFAWGRPTLLISKNILWLRCPSVSGRFIYEWMRSVHTNGIIISTENNSHYTSNRFVGCWRTIIVGHRTRGPFDATRSTRISHGCYAKLLPMRQTCHVSLVQCWQVIVKYSLALQAKSFQIIACRYPL